MTATKLTKGTRYDIDSLTFAGWSGPDEAIANADESLDCWAYFADGVYLGPDSDGVEPLFAAPSITIDMIEAGTGRMMRLTADTIGDALRLIRIQYPYALDITGDWAGCDGDREERQIVADDADDAPVIATLRRPA